MDGELIKLPKGVGPGPVDFAAVELDADSAFTALYTWPPVAYPLFATDRRSGQVLWSSNVWAVGDYFGGTGQGWHFVAVRSATQRLAVFGMDSRTVYVEVFDKKTGQNLCRFSTAYVRPFAQN